MKVFIETYGCDTNKVSTEIMAASLIEAGHTFTTKTDAELIIINSCSLEPTVERKVLKRLGDLRDSKAKILVAGCMGEVQKELIHEKLPNASLAGVDSAYHIADIVNKMGEGMRVLRFNDKARAPAGAAHVRINPAVAVVQIAKGCLENCTFCIDRSIVGSLQSYDPDKMLHEIRNAISNGCVEIHLAGHDIASYGLDTEMSLPALLRKIGVMAGTYRVKLGPMNPANVTKILDDLIPSFNRPNMYQYIDLPLQSGSNRMLSAMKRRYTAEDYKKIVNAFRDKYPYITLSTDVMVGYPNEMEEDFQDTVAVLRETKPDILNVYAYGERPFTKGGPTNIPSWKMKERFMGLQHLALELRQESFKKWLNWSGELLVSEKVPAGYVGRNYAYMPVFLPHAQLGQSGTWEITGVDGAYLRAK